MIEATGTEFMPTNFGLFYGGKWHEPVKKGSFDTFSPGTGKHLAKVAEASAEDVDRAMAAAYQGFLIWRDVPPLERARIMREGAAIFRQHAAEIALLDSTDGGNPVSAMVNFVIHAAVRWEFFAGLVTEIKGASIPMGPNAVNFWVREPRGVVLRIAPFNHPFIFSAAHVAAALAAGNSVVIKPPEQAPLSALRAAELLGGLLPPGVFNVLPGQRETGKELVNHKHVAMISLTGSAQTGAAVMAAAAKRVTPVILELGGKNALIAYEDADPDTVAEAAVRGMNFTWCGQSCGSTSRAFIHRNIYDAVLERMPAYIKNFVPGDPADSATTMGAVISKAQLERILYYIKTAHDEGARLICGGKQPSTPGLADGFFIEPTVFADVNQSMTIAREEIFGPVVAVIPWEDEARMVDDVNSVDYGLTCSIWTHRLERAHRTASRVNVGYLWINDVGKHFQGAPFGGNKRSGIGREGCVEELYAYSQEKNIHINLTYG
jgi:betaine-aldehyde dehydrogenase